MTVPAVDRLAVIGFGVGGLGFVIGSLGLIFSIPLLGWVAGLCALASWAAVLRLNSLRGAEQGAAGAGTAPAGESGLAADPAPVRETATGLEGDAAAALVTSPGPADDEAALNDPATGLFNERYFHVTLQTRILAARRHLRPVALVLLDVAQGVDEGTVMSTSADPAVVAESIRVTLRDADTACRLQDGRFALVLEDTPENGAVWTVERVRRHLSADHAGFTMRAGVACYPAHAFDAADVLDRAEKALAAAREWQQDRIEVATSE